MLLWWEGRETEKERGKKKPFGERSWLCKVFRLWGGLFSVGKKVNLITAHFSLWWGGWELLGLCTHWMHRLPQAASEPLIPSFPVSKASIRLESPSLATLPLAPALFLGTCPEAASPRHTPSMLCFIRLWHFMVNSKQTQRFTFFSRYFPYTPVFKLVFFLAGLSFVTRVWLK